MKRKPLRRSSIVTALVLASPLITVGPASASPGDGDGDGAQVFLTSSIAVDRVEGTITLPLLEGRHDGQTVWYVVTESSDADDARARGVNFSGPIAVALGTRAVQSAPLVGGLLDFTGTVDFSPERIVVAGPDAFAPSKAQAGAVGDADYSPLVTPDGKIVLNASQVANASGLHDAIIDIDFGARTVELDTLNGFYDDKQVQYLHQEASIELVAALEGSTWAPNLDAAPGVGVFDANRSARAAIIPVVNGPKGAADPQRQGLQSALSGEGDPLNVTQIVPGKGGYTPVWDVTPVVWTQAAIDAGERIRLTDEGQIANYFAKGLLTSAGSGPASRSLKGIRALPGISNCPVVIEF